MNGRAIAVVGLLIGLTQSQVKASTDLLIEQNVSHGTGDEGVEAQGEFAEVTSPFVAIENLSQGFVVGA